MFGWDCPYKLSIDGKTYRFRNKAAKATLLETRAERKRPARLRVGGGIEPAYHLVIPPEDAAKN